MISSGTRKKKILIWLLTVIIALTEAQVNPECGIISNNSSLLNAENGKELPSPFPWHVAIFKKPNNKLKCGGTIISSYIVISAAHCFYTDIKNLHNHKNIYEVVVAKTIADYDTNDSQYQSAYKVEKIGIPVEYNDIDANFAYDIAIIQLEEEIQFNIAVLPLCINFEETSNSILDGSAVMFSGWGIDDFGKPIKNLYTRNLTLHNYRTCIDKYPFENKRIITLDKICVEGTNESKVRLGESGEGFFYLQPHTNKYYLGGIASTIIDRRFPISLFVNINFHKEWIGGTIFEIEQNKLKKRLSCLLPKHESRNVTIRCNNNTYNPIDQRIPDACRLTMDCNEKSTFNSSCSNGKWIPEIPLLCLGGCPMLSGENMYFQCYKDNKQVECSDTLPNRSVLKVMCSETHYLESTAAYEEITCMNGQWSQDLPTCVLICGSMSRVVPLIEEGVPENRGEAPWHVAIYRKFESTGKTLICGGTIISENIILSAAHCFYDGKSLRIHDKHIYDIVVAKVQRNYDSIDGRHQRSYKIEEIRIPDSYHDIQTNYAFDIALIHLKEDIQFNSEVLPICLDSTESDFEIPDGTVGKVSGWGNDNSGHPSETLLTINLTVSSYKNCINSFPREDRASVSLDKICGGNRKGAGPRRGDSGGGFIFLHPNTGNYHLRGIVSVKVGTTVSISCFTNIMRHEHKLWIKQNVEEINNKVLKKKLPCQLPQPVNYTSIRMTRSSCNRNVYNLDHNEVADSCGITVKCRSSAYHFVSTCSNGTWTPKIPASCLGDISASSLRTEQFQCFRNSNEPIACSEVPTNCTGTGITSTRSFISPLYFILVAFTVTVTLFISVLIYLYRP